MPDYKYLVQRVMEGPITDGPFTGYRFTGCHKVTRYDGTLMRVFWAPPGNVDGDSNIGQGFEIRQMREAIARDSGGAEVSTEVETDRDTINPFVLYGTDIRMDRAAVHRVFRNAELLESDEGYGNT